MNIMVCIKQVPDTEMIKVDPITGSLIRDGVPSITNPCDLSAVEAALRLKEAYGGSITAVCMGPPQATESLRQCLAMGADNAVLISDRVFKDSDTLATSYVLSLAAKQFGSFELILCGKHSLDGETGQVGPQIAEHLGWNQVTYAVQMKLSGKNFLVQREVEGGIEVLETALPLVCTIDKTRYEARIPTMKNRIAAKKALITEMSSATLKNLDLSRTGLEGSPTSVSRSFVPPLGEPGLIIKESDPKQVAAKLVQLLVQAQAI